MSNIMLIDGIRNIKKRLVALEEQTAKQSELLLEYEERLYNLENKGKQPVNDGDCIGF